MTPSKEASGSAPLAAPARGTRHRQLARLLTRQPLVPMFLLIFAQALLIALFVHPRAVQQEGDLAYVAHLGTAVRYLIYFSAALALALTAKLADLWHSLSAVQTGRDWQKFLIAQLLCYGFLLLVIGVLVPNDLFRLALPVHGHETAWSGLLIIGIAAILASTLLLLAPAAWWGAFVKKEKWSIVLAVAFTAGIYIITSIFQDTWDDFLSVPTIVLSRFILEIFHDGIVANPETKELGIGNFVVLISSTCSGYEGMGMITAFLAWYSLTFRQDLKYPNALLLYPVALLAMWIFNGIRIAALIGIGHAFSPEIAMQGFHSNAGWIYFLCVSIGMILVARRIPFFSGKSGDTLLQIDSLNVLLVPELVLLCATLLTSAFSAGFDWLYPLRVVATAIALLYFWKKFDLGRLPIHAVPVAIGIAVFFLWIGITPTSTEADRQFGAELAGVSSLAAAIWLAVRAAGAVLVVPLAEELAFRGYLINLLSGGSSAAAGRFLLLPLLLSSIAFGALHSDWLAGAIAGLAFGLARYFRGRIWDAVVAHMVTNGLLAAYVLATQRWSYW